jgi:hypothetical protein
MRSVAMTLVLAVTARIAQGQTSPPAGRDGDADGDGVGIFKEVSVIDRGVAFAQRFLGESGQAPKDGFYPELGNMITGSVWISAGPGYRRHFLNDHATVEGSAAVSWREYRIAQSGFELNDLANQIDDLGIGANSNEGARASTGCGTPTLLRLTARTATTPFVP